MYSRKDEAEGPVEGLLLFKPVRRAELMQATRRELGLDPPTAWRAPA
jgi:hypothetical protein